MSSAVTAKQTIAVIFSNGDNSQQADISASISSYDELLGHVGKAFKQAQQDIIITDGHKDICSDEQVKQLQPGQRIFVRKCKSKEVAVFKERISFNPHPKTLTMAGDYEYFAAQGYHPLAFALAELIDNALRATKSNKQRPRSITVSLVTDDKGSKGMVCVRDNGSGMTVQELNNWAVMNLSMEDRGLLSTDDGKAGNRYLSSDISFFGVGSKNAAFYLGRTVKVVTKTVDSDYVHELCIQAAELERRYTEGQAVYEEEMLHRQLGDEASLNNCEQSFPLAHHLLQHETEASKVLDCSFTRVLIYNLKSEVLAQLCDEDDGAGVLRDLAHLYHYYLHGALGNQFTTSHAAGLPNGEQVPDLLVERLQGDSTCWTKSLVKVDDDLESRYLRAQRSHLEFELSVPNHGRVEGVLWYFPFENDQETVPIDPYTLGRMRLSSHKDGSSQHPGHGPLTQIGPSQIAHFGASQRPQCTQAGKGQPDAYAEQDASYKALLAACPTFEAFWQGRLIPGACVDTLPFIRNVRMKRNAATRDLLPDEVFSRVRGALFFGPGFRVTRNKLTFRDNLAMLLETASPVNRQLEKQFKEWLVNCHKQLDRNVRFEVLCNQSLQAQARKHLGQDVTVFERVHDGLQTIRKGDVVKLSTKPTILGRVLHFSIPQVVQTEGCYSGGRVTVCALPEEVLGADNLHTWPLRRLEGLVSAEELQDHVNRELSKLPTALRLEPIRLAAGSVLTLPAGTGLPETSISVLSGAGNKIVKALIGGQRQQLKVVQTLYYLGPAGTARKRTAASASQGNSAAGEVTAADLEADAAQANAEVAVAKKGSKKTKRRKKGGQAAEATEKENEQPAAAPAVAIIKKAIPESDGNPEDDGVPDGELLLSHENKSPIGDKYQFQRITGGITRAGCYSLQYTLSPELPNGRMLRYTIELEVAAGPPVSFDIKGEGRAVALSKSIMLGEALPPVRLQLQDSHGNTVQDVAELLAERPVQLQVLTSSLVTGGAVIQDLQVEAQMENQHGEVLLTNLRVLGPNPPPAGSSGMQLFKAVKAGATGSSSQPAGDTDNTITLAVVHSINVFLAAYVEGLPPQGFPMRLMPGAPHSLRLLKGHPFCHTQQQEEDAPLLTQLAPNHQLVPAEIMSGEELQAFKVQTLDIWGNPTCPNDALPFDVVVQCPAAEPEENTFTVDDRGIATISGISIFRQSNEAVSNSQTVEAGSAQPHHLLLWPRWEDCQQPLLQPAIELAQPQSQLGLQLLVHPSNKPARLYITHHGKDLESRIQEGEGGEGEQVIWQLTDVEAGSRVDGLAVLCVDEVGRPAEGGVPGRIQVSWAKGSKKAILGSNEIRLPGLQAPDAVGAPQQFWVRFSADQKLYPGVTFDINFEVSVIAGPPHSWSVAIVDFQKGTAAAAKGAAPKDAEELSLIQCGQPFYLEIEVLDQCHNRSRFAAGDRPMPIVEATADDPDTELQLDPSSWKKKWDQTQAGGDVCLYKLWVAGPPGPVRLRIRDTAGEDGACLLQEDELSITLLPGPPVALVADCPQELECSTRGLLESLPLKCVDCYGNIAEGANFEVSLNGSALNDQGVAARVTAQDSNRIALRKGIAVFKNIRIQAQSEGVYKLTLGSSSRKFVVQEAMVMVKVAQLNYVCNLEVLPGSLACEESISVGCRLHVLVAVDTEDQQPVPLEDLSSSIRLKLSAPAAGAAASSSKGRKVAQKTDVILLDPAGMWDPEHAPDGLSSAAAEAAATNVGRGCIVLFTTEELLMAGQYTVAAEYTEQREQLLMGLPKQEQTVRSTSLQFNVAAGPVSTAELTAGGADQESFAISNGKEAAQRRLLRNAAVQLQDSHSNPTCVPDIPIRWRLSVADGDSAGDDALEAPELCCSAGDVQLKTDENGRAYFGEVAVVQDSGRMPSGSLLCTLELQVLVPRVKSRRSSTTTGSWSTVWQRQVLFTDNASRIRELQGLQEQKEQLQQQLATVKENMQETHQRLQSAQQDEAAATRAVSKQMNVLKQKLQPTNMELPGNSKEAQQLVQQLQQAAEGQAKRPDLEARYGGQRHSMTLAITKLLQLGDSELVGVFAQLGYINESRLSAVLAANYASSLQVVVVKSYEAINRLRSVAQEQHLQAVPSMTSYSLIQEYTPEGAASSVKMSGVSNLAQRLLDEACRGTDPPLPIPLPHTRSLCILESQGRAAPEGLSKDQWPEGCLGYAVNLVRPAMSNSRKGLLFAQLGRTLVFETVDQGAQYRQYAIKALRASVPDIVTLDGGKLSGRGVVLGSGFRVCKIEEAQCRFGTIPASHQVGCQHNSLQQSIAAAETAVTVLQQQEAAEEELAAAQAAAAAEQHQELEQQHSELQRQLKELSQKIRQQQHSIEGGSRKSGRSGQATQGTADEPQAIDLVAADDDEPADKASAQQETRQHRSKRRRH